MSEIIQSYTGTLDNLNMSGLVFSLNMSGAQSTLGDHKFALRSITFTKPSSSGYQDPVYLNLWEMKEGESTYTYITSSTNASNTTTSSDGVWNFTSVELDIDSKYYITVTASPSSVMSDLILLRSRVYSVPSGSGVGSHNYINNYNPPSLQFNWMPVMSLTLDETIEGSINISKGYYDSGSAKIIMPSSTVTLTDLKSGETVGCKNKLFAYSKNNVAGAKITGNANEDITTAHDVSVDLNQPIYLDHTKEYIAGGSLIEPDWSFSNGGYTANYTVNGSPTISSEYVASGFSSSNYLTTPAAIDLSSASTWEFVTKVTVGSTSYDQKIILGAGLNFGITSSGYLHIWLRSTSSWFVDENIVSGSSVNDKYLKIEYTGSVYNFYSSDDGSTWTLLKTINNSTKVGVVSTIDIGNSGSEYWRGSIDLSKTSLSANGVVVWKALLTVTPGITTQKALLYDNANDKTFWYPSATSLALSNFATPADRSNIYYLNLLNVAAQLHAGESAPVSGDYLKSSNYVYLNHAHDKILGVQEEPDEIVLEGGPWTQPTLSSNGIWGGTEFAVSSSTVLSSDSEAWKAFDGIPDTSSNDRWHSSSGHPSWIGWYNPEPLIITNIQVQNRAVDGSFINSYDVSYSDDGSTWTVSTSGTSPDQTDGAYWNIPISETTGHKYWKLISNSSSGSNSDYTAVGLITLTAHTDSIKASDSHYWTYLQSDTYDVQGATLAISSMSPSALTGHLMMTTAGVLSYSEVNAQLSVGGLLPGAAYTGYDVTFTDNTYTAIDSVDKVGTRYRIYRSAGINPEVPIEFVAMSYEDYGSFAGGALPSASKSYGLTVDSPIEYTSTTTFTLSTDEIQGFDYYNPTEDKFYVYETGLWTGYQALSYIGDMYVIDSTGD